VNRLAGDRLKQDLGRDDLDSIDFVTALAALSGVGGLTTTGIVNLLDYFMGDATINNSGEYLANAAITAIPLGTAAAGVGLVMARDPLANEMVGLLGDTAAARQVASQYGGDAVMTMLSGGQTATPDRGAVDDAARKVSARAQRIEDEVLRKIGSDYTKYGPQPSGVPIARAAESAVVRSGRNLIRGGGIGALLGSVPAVMLMQDRGGQEDGSRKKER